MKLRVTGTEQEITEFANSFVGNPWGYKVESVSKHYPNRRDLGLWSVYIDVDAQGMDVSFLDKDDENITLTPVKKDDLEWGDPVDVCTNRGGWRGKGKFVRYEGDELAVVQRKGREEETYHKSRVRYSTR